MSKTRAIRFSEHEDKLIEEFLRENPYFDFSTVARMAILNFIRDPKMTIKAVGRPTDQKHKRPHGNV